MNFKRIEKTSEELIVNFLFTLDEDSLNTYTRWRSFSEPSSIAQKIIKENLSGNEIGWMFLENGVMAGYEHLNYNHPFRNDVVKEGFIVSPSFAGKGIGSIMKQKCIEEAKKLNLYKVVALVYENNWSSLHVDLKNNFLIGGIFFNEEKIGQKNRFLVYLERPIKLKATQDNYFSIFENFYSKFRENHESIQNNLNEYDISEISINKIKQALACGDAKNLIYMKNFLSNSSSKSPNNYSELIILKYSDQIVCYANLEFFLDKPKQHVAKIQMYILKNDIPEKILAKMIRKLVDLLERHKKEKLWINVAENDGKLIRSLLSNNFVLEAVELGDKLINSKPINVFCLAYHFEKINSRLYLDKMKELLKYK